MFSERLKQLRKEKGLTQTELAKILDISTGTIAMWETGKRRPSFDMLDKLTDFFDKRLDYVLGTSDDASSPKSSESEISTLGNWAVQEEYEDMIRNYSLLDEYGKKTVLAVLRSEFARCSEQGTHNNVNGISVSVKIRDTNPGK